MPRRRLKMALVDERALLDEVEAFQRAWNAGDADQLADFFTEDAVRVGAFGDIQRGREEITAAFRHLLHERMPGATLQQDRGTVRMLSPELALWQGAIRIRLPQGPPLRGHAVQVMRRVGQRWLVLEAHPKLFPASAPSEGAVSAAHAQEARTLQQATDTMGQYLEAFARRDFEGMRRLFHPDYAYTGAGGQPRAGPPAGVAVARTYTTAFPDQTLEVIHMHATGDHGVVTECIARGTHQGELMGIAPTGRRIEVPLCIVVEVQNGQILAQRDYFDSGLLYQQLGVAP
jgi:uncharacterized protein (TIGR02246 family)/steroid delta-isomerase-like uncharacterized protein